MFIITAMVVSHIVYHLKICVVYYDICGNRIDEEAYKCNAKSKNSYVTNVLKELPSSHIKSWVQYNRWQQKIKEEILLELVLISKFLWVKEPYYARADDTCNNRIARLMTTDWLVSLIISWCNEKEHHKREQDQVKGHIFFLFLGLIWFFITMTSFQ